MKRFSFMNWWKPLDPIIIDTIGSSGLPVTQIMNSFFGFCWCYLNIVLLFALHLFCYFLNSIFTFIVFHIFLPCSRQEILLLFSVSGITFSSFDFLSNYWWNLDWLNWNSLFFFFDIALLCSYIALEWQLLSLNTLRKFFSCYLIAFRFDLIQMIQSTLMTFLSQHSCSHLSIRVRSMKNGLLFESVLLFQTCFSFFLFFIPFTPNNWVIANALH